MSNTLLTISMITREALRVLENNLKFTKTVSREYDDKFAVSGAKINTTLNIRKPPRYTVSTGEALDVQGSTESQVALVLDQRKQVAISFSTQDLTMTIDDYSNRFLKPAIAALSNEIDFIGLNMYKEVANFVGTPGVVPNALSTYLDAMAKLDEEATPVDDMRQVVVGPRMNVAIIDALKGLFQSAGNISSQYKSGRMAEAAGFDWIMDQNIRTHVVGALGGTPLVNGASQIGSSIVTDGWTASAATRLKRGDVITFASVNATNPQNRQSTGNLRQFVVTADTASDGSGNMTIPIDPPLQPGGQFQTVDASPADNAIILIFGHASSYANVNSPTGLAYHRDAFTMATADLELPGGVQRAARVSDKQLGISLRMVQAYNIQTDQIPCRIDVLFGYKTLYKELACRVQS